MTVHYTDRTATVHHGDCLDVLRELPDHSIDAVVTDPPYGLEFMGKDWDAPWQSGAGLGGHSAGLSDVGFTDGSRRLPRPNYMGSTNPTCRNCGGLRNGTDAKKGQPRCRCDAPRFDNTTLPRMRAFQVWCELWAAECLRVLKPGGHLLAFGGTRTFHRLACAIEDAGFEIRDSIAWLYGSGFPKSLDVSKAIDRAAGAERERVTYLRSANDNGRGIASGAGNYGGGGVTAATDRSSDTPATDDARTWQGWGTALKPAFEPIVVARKPLAGTVAANVLQWGTGALNIDACRIGTSGATTKKNQRPGTTDSVSVYDHGLNGGGPTPIDAGRWPANVALDETQAAALDQMSGETLSQVGSRGQGGGQGAYSVIPAQPDVTPGFGDTGGASRYFYTAKASSSERIRLPDGVPHPTVKPLSLMRWLVRLVTPPGGLVLDPFAGSGTTVEACILEGFRCTAIEREADYLPLIVQRVNRQRDPIAYTAAAGEDLGLFGLLDDPT